MAFFKDDMVFQVTDGPVLLAEAIIYKTPVKLCKKLPAHLRGGDTLYLHRVWVRKKNRGNGLARVVLRAAVDWADSKGISLVLRVLPFDIGVSERKLRRFYNEYSFKNLRGSKELMTRA